MSVLRPTRPEELIRVLERAGFLVTVPVHPGREVGRGLLRKILRDAELSVEDFLSLR